MNISIFKKNGKVIGAFDDKNKFKVKTFHYILESLISKKYFKTKKQCGNKIKEDLKLLYSEPDYTFVFKECKFEKSTIELNEIENIEIVKDQSENIYVYYTLKDLNKPLELLNVKDLYSLQQN